MPDVRTRGPRGFAGDRKSSLGGALVGLAALLLAGPMRAQPAATSAVEPVGMVDQPCPADSFGRTAAEQAYARAVVNEGLMDPLAMAAMAAEAPLRTRQEARRLSNDWADLCRYRQENARDAASGRVRVVFIGNSITELWKAAEPDLFQHGVVNRGISGQTSGQTLVRFQQDVVALHPLAVHILVGTNDVAGNNGPTRPEDLQNNIRAMVAIAKANHIQVLLGAITPAGTIPWRSSIHPTAQIRALNAWMSNYARSAGVTYVDYYSVLAGPDGAMKPGISRDGVHPLTSGYRMMDGPLRAAMAKARLP